MDTTCRARWVWRRAVAGIAFVLALGARCDSKAPPPPPGTLQVVGRLTDEGAECPALRDEQNVLYTLAGSIGSFRPGDRVCVHGRRAEVSTCMQGVTISVDSIVPASQCR